MAYLNLFFKTLLVVLLFAVSQAHAIEVHALYFASCNRELGIILDVNDRYFHLLNLNGEIKKIQRYEVIYWASYPIDVVPISKVKSPDTVPVTRIKSFDGEKLQTFIEGWPIDFSKEKVSFLSLEGSEVSIKRSKIWEIERFAEQKKLEFEDNRKVEFNFVHPYVFAFCEKNKKSAAVNIFPQHLENDPVKLKRHFDELADGYEELEGYYNDQQFYPMPEIYKNVTSLGMWFTTGSRYGSSEQRTSNFSPFLVDDLSEGPFKYQRTFRTGADIMPYSVHEEVQTQAYFKMKADYFHFSTMVDPNLLLVGSKYEWQREDVKAGDYRVNDSTLIEFGFDYGAFALNLYVISRSHFGAATESKFFGSNFSIPRFGLTYTGMKNSWDFWFGFASSDNYQAGSVFRFNYNYIISPRRKFSLSYIHRDLDYEGLLYSLDPAQQFLVSSVSDTGALYYFQKVSARVLTGVFTSYESFSSQYGNTALSEIRKDNHFKLGVMSSLSF